MVITNSTTLNGVGTILSLISLLFDTRKMPLITDRNITQPDGVQQIRALSGKHCSRVDTIDNMSVESVHRDVRQLMDALGDVPSDVMVGVGGGNASDAAKLLLMLCHSQSLGLDALPMGEKLTQRV